VGLPAYTGNKATVSSLNLEINTDKEKDCPNLGVADANANCVL